MSALTLDALPKVVIIEILKRCEGKDLAALSMTCSSFYSMMSEDYLWKQICQKELQQDVVDLGSIESYKKLYSNMLYKYKSILGTHQVEWGHYGGFLEVKVDAGTIKGTVMEGSVEEGKIFDDLREEVLFTIKAETYPPELICLPDLDPHSLTISVDQVTGNIEYRCKNTSRHLDACTRRFKREVDMVGEDEEDEDEEDEDEDEYMFLSVWERSFRKLKHLKKQMKKGNPMISVPLKLPYEDEIPASLRKPDGSIPHQIITPGLFKGDYSSHGVELILFKYVSENELQGFKVTGDSNVSAGKITLKCFLDYPVTPTLSQQKSIRALKSIPKTKRTAPLHALPEQKFKIPDDVYELDALTFPELDRCFARYHGQCQIAYENYQKPRFIPTHFVVFNNNLIGAVIFSLNNTMFLSRVEKSFKTNINDNVNSVF